MAIMLAGKISKRIFDPRSKIVIARLSLGLPTPSSTYFSVPRLTFLIYSWTSEEAYFCTQRKESSRRASRMCEYICLAFHYMHPSPLHTNHTTYIHIYLYPHSYFQNIYMIFLPKTGGFRQRISCAQKTLPALSFEQFYSTHKFRCDVLTYVCRFW